MEAAAQQPKVVRTPNKRTGGTYLYKNHPYWDKEAKQGRSSPGVAHASDC